MFYLAWKLGDENKKAASLAFLDRYLLRHAAYMVAFKYSKQKVAVVLIYSVFLLPPLPSVQPSFAPDRE